MKALSNAMIALSFGIFGKLAYAEDVSLRRTRLEFKPSARGRLAEVSGGLMNVHLSNSTASAGLGAG
jgi:hypothetical protein